MSLDGCEILSVTFDLHVLHAAICLFVEVVCSRVALECILKSLRQTPGNGARLWSWFDIVATRVFTTSCDGPTVQNNWFKMQDESASQYLIAVLFCSSSCISLFLKSAEILGCPAAAVFSAQTTHLMAVRLYHIPCWGHLTFILLNLKK